MQSWNKKTMKSLEKEAERIINGAGTFAEVCFFMAQVERLYTVYHQKDVSEELQERYRVIISRVNRVIEMMRKNN